MYMVLINYPLAIRSVTLIANSSQPHRACVYTYLDLLHTHHSRFCLTRYQVTLDPCPQPLSLSTPDLVSRNIILFFHWKPQGVNYRRLARQLIISRPGRRHAIAHSASEEEAT